MGQSPRAVGAAHPAGKHFNTHHLGFFNTAFENQQHRDSTTKTITKVTTRTTTIFNRRHPTAEIFQYIALQP